MVKVGKPNFPIAALIGMTVTMISPKSSWYSQFVSDAPFTQSSVITYSNQIKLDEPTEPAPTYTE